MVKVLVTGATGFVGAAIVRRLVEKGLPVRITVRERSDRRNIQGLDVEEVTADVVDEKSIHRAVQGCSHVYHVAGMYRTWMRDYGQLARVNVTGTENVLKAALSCGIKKLVHTSSIGALGLKRDGSRSDENTPFNLHEYRLPYEKSKYDSEQVAFAYSKKGLPVVVVRPALVMGEGDIYPTPSGKIVLDVMRGKIPSYFDGGIDIVDVEDAAEGHILAMERGRAGEGYNLGNTDNFTNMKDLFGMIAAEGGVKPPQLRVPVFMAMAWAYAATAVSDYITHREPVATPGNIQALTMKKRVDFSKAVSELGLPQTPLRETIRRTVNWYRKEGYF